MTDEKIVLKGRAANGFAVKGYALVCPNSIQGWAALDVTNGEIIEKGHINIGETVKDKVLVVPCSRGSTGWSDYLYSCHLNGCGPAAYIVTNMDSKCATAVTMADVPCVADFPKDYDPCNVIKTGDYVSVEGHTGIVEILRRA